MLTATSDRDAAFAALLLALADGPWDIRVLLTVRSDYFYLTSAVKDDAGKPALFERLTADNNSAILRLKAMSREGLREAVMEPLTLAGAPGETALAKAVQTDISDQPSDLPLLQVALRAAWKERQQTGQTMLECYQNVGRVSGALTREADKAVERLSPDERALLESIFVRLVRLGDTGGATRLGASLDDFDPPPRALLQKLGGDEYGRLVSVGAMHAELAHEALITQWPWLQGTLKNNAADVRALGRLIFRTKEWSVATEEKRTDYVASGAFRGLFNELIGKRPEWVALREHEFVTASNAAHESEQARWEQALRAARRNESLALTALANVEAGTQPINAAKLALAAWPRDEHDTITPKLAETLDVLGKILPAMGERRLLGVRARDRPAQRS